MQSKLFVIVNHSAARARQAWASVRAALNDSAVPFAAHEAQHVGDAQAQTRAALLSGYRTIAVVGGDGTLSEVVAGFFAQTDEANINNAPVPINSRAALAVLPGGTGNDFARSLEGQRATLAHWLDTLITHCRRDTDDTTRAVAPPHNTTRAVDLLRGVAMTVEGVHAFFCLNAATLGIGAEVAGRVAAQGQLVRRLSGEARFGLAAVAALARWRLRRLRIQVDDEAAQECRTNLVAVVNSRFAGGGMMFSPTAQIDDGCLDVVTAAVVTRAMIIREMTRIHRGGHVANPRVQIRRGTRVRIEHLHATDALAIEADGDVRGQTPVELRVWPGALRVVC